MKVMNNGFYCDVDLESKITNCWSITNDLGLLAEAILDFEKPKEVIFKMLEGLIYIYDLKFALINIDYEKIVKAFEENEIVINGNFEKNYQSCYELLNDMGVLLSYMQEKEMSEDEMANAFIGLETIGNIKFENLFDDFAYIVKNFYKIKS